MRTAHIPGSKTTGGGSPRPPLSDGHECPQDEYEAAEGESVDETENRI